MSTPTTTNALTFGSLVMEYTEAGHAVLARGSGVNDLIRNLDGGFGRNPEVLAEYAAASGQATVVMSPQGTRQVAVEGLPLMRLRPPATDAPHGQAIRELRDQLRVATEPALLIVDYVDIMLPEAAAATLLPQDLQQFVETLVEFPKDPSLARHGLVLLARADAPDPRFARVPGFKEVVLGSPDEETRLAIAQRIEDRHRADPAAVGGLEPGLAAERFARDTGGLSGDQIMRLAKKAAQKSTPISSREIQQTRTDILRQRGGDNLIVYESNRGMESVAGQAQVRYFLHVIKLRGYVPRAAVLAGAAGTGKTHVVEAVACELGWPAVAYGSFRGMYVGQTESNLREIHDTVTAMQPVVVHIDEADQDGMGERNAGASTSSGVEERITKEQFAFLGDADPQTQVLYLMTTNRPDRFDVAAQSRAHFIPILHPTRSEQTQLLQLESGRHGFEIDGDLANQVIADWNEPVVSGRMIVKLVEAAHTEALIDGESAPSLRHFNAATGLLLERVDPIEDERMALKALERTTLAYYLPWVAAERLGEPVEYLPYVEPLLEPHGSLNMERLRARIRELDQLAAERRHGGSA